jgi:hypothetical protein
MGSIVNCVICPTLYKCSILMMRARPGPTYEETSISGRGAEWLSANLFSLCVLWAYCHRWCPCYCGRSCQVGKCTWDCLQSSTEIPHPSFRVLPPEPTFARVLRQSDGFKLTSVDKRGCWIKNWKMCSPFSSFLFYFCNLYCTHPGSNYFGQIFL